MGSPELLGFIEEIELDRRSNLMLEDDIRRAEHLISDDIRLHIRATYGIDLSALYAGIRLAHPFGKAAGQLSMSPRHIASDISNGFSFTAMKSAVGVTKRGNVGIDDWGKTAPKMVLEQRESVDGRLGWTVTWKGRGWNKGFEAYIRFYRKAIEQNVGYPVFPSLMVDVTDRERAISQAEYCIGRLMDVHSDYGLSRDFMIEIDISPTLNLLPGSDNDEVFENFVRTSVCAFREGLNGYGKAIVKLPNAGRGAEFQLRLAQASIDEGGDCIAAMIVGNRLFDRNAEFEGQKGIAYGGWDLSNANLETLDLLKSRNVKIPLIGTGNICSGRMMAEYAIRGCAAGQIHTFLQLPPDAYRAQSGLGSRTQRALRELIYHPDDGLVSVMLRLGKSGKLSPTSGILHFMDLPSIYAELKDKRNG